MTTVKDVESAVSTLSPQDLKAFRAWFEEFDARAWDQQIERDIHSGKLDELAEQAMRSLKSGQCRQL